MAVLPASKKRRLDKWYYKHLPRPSLLYAPQPEASDHMLMPPTIQLMDGVWEVLPAHFRKPGQPYAQHVHGWTANGMFHKLHAVMKIIEGHLYDDPRIKDGDHVPEFFHHRLNMDRIADPDGKPSVLKLDQVPQVPKAYRFTIQVPHQLKVYADTVIGNNAVIKGLQHCLSGFPFDPPMQDIEKLCHNSKGVFHANVNLLEWNVKEIQQQANAARTLLEHETDQWRLQVTANLVTHLKIKMDYMILFRGYLYFLDEAYVDFFCSSEPSKLLWGAFCEILSQLFRQGD